MNPREHVGQEADVAFDARQTTRARRVSGGLILGAVPLALMLWVLASRVLGLDVIFAARAAMLTALPFVVVAIFAPLALIESADASRRAYVVQWFVMALFFNVVWQVPPVVFRSAFEGVARTQANLPSYVFWWGYHSSDLDYRDMTPFWVLAEVSFWVIAVPVIVGLADLRRGCEARAWVWLGVSGALQVYNVAFFIAYGGIVERFANIATDAPIAPILYWTFNLLWGIAGGVASVLSFQCLFRLRGGRREAAG